MLEKIELWFARRWVRRKLVPSDQYLSQQLADMYAMIEEEAKAEYTEDGEIAIHQMLATAFTVSNKQVITNTQHDLNVDLKVTSCLTTLRSIMEREFGPSMFSFITPIIEAKMWRNWRAK